MAIKQLGQAVKNSFKFYGLWAILAIAYLVITWFSLSNRYPAVAKYNLSASSLHIVSISLAGLLAIIWLLAIYGYIKLAEYSSLVKKAKDGKLVAKLARGLAFLAFSLPLVSITSGLLNYFSQLHPDLKPSLTIASHYVSLLLPLIAFWMINGAAEGLTEYVKQQPAVKLRQFSAFMLVASGIFYTYLVLANTSLSHTAQQQVYYMPGWLVVLTLIIPYVFMWYLGGLAALEIYTYMRKVRGVLYRRRWAFISAGLATIIMADIIAQYLTTLTIRINRLHIGSVLLIIYLLLILIAIGFVLVAVGAKKLRSIEEI